MHTTVTELDAKRRALMPWLWAATVLAMLTSLGEGTKLLIDLGTAWYVAVLFPLASDVGLVASLRGTAALSDAGLDSRAARPLRWFASLFCLALNTAGSVIAGHWVAALFHAGIPALVITLATFEERYSAEFAALIRQQREADRLAAEAERARINAEAAAETVTPESAPAIETTKPTPPRKPATAVTRPRRSDAELVAELRKMIAANNGKTPPRREITATLGVSPNRAGRLVAALDSANSEDTRRAYL
ncbi:MAG TPA: hypothetical protein VM677_27880 [Actinokineospora sp.]|jgi:hypothetical protein|nr:hypothetical protein [Actinokineospora sp.]